MARSSDRLRGRGRLLAHRAPDGDAADVGRRDGAAGHLRPLAQDHEHRGGGGRRRAGGRAPPRADLGAAVRADRADGARRPRRSTRTTRTTWSRNSSPPAFQWDPASPATAQLVTGGGGTVANDLGTWGEARLSGRAYAYVTWVNDAVRRPAAAADQSVTADYKRVTVAVTADAPEPADEAGDRVDDRRRPGGGGGAMRLLRRLRSEAGSALPAVVGVMLIMGILAAVIQQTSTQVRDAHDDRARREARVPGRRGGAPRRALPPQQGDARARPPRSASRRPP